MKTRHLAGFVVLVYVTLLSAHSSLAQFAQQGLKLVGTGAGVNARLGTSVCLSADGNTAIVGGPNDNGNAGAAWVWTRSRGVWTQQGAKLVGSGAVGNANQGYSVSLSADGITAIVGGVTDNGQAGAAWVWTRNGAVWTQQGAKLVGSGATSRANQGWSVSLSANGDTAIVGAPFDNTAGAAWVWTRNQGVWMQQGIKLVGSGVVGNANQGHSVSLSADGNTAIVGGPQDNGDTGAAWVWTRSGAWTQQGGKLVGSGAGGAFAAQGDSVSLSADGNTAIVGGPLDNYDFSLNTGVGAAWSWIRTGGVWSQQGAKLVGVGASGNAEYGARVSLSGDGKTAIVGGPLDDNSTGAAWVFSAALAAGQPDLVPQSVLLSSTSMTTGGTLTVNVTVKNQGTGNAAATITSIRLNNISGSSSSSDPIQQGVSTPPITVGSNATMSATFTLKTAGIYYAHVYVDSTAVLSQSNVGNDTYHSGPITVSATQLVRRRAVSPPRIYSFAPAQGPSGTRVLITGAGFSSHSLVTFGGHTTPALLIDAGQLAAIVPLQIKGTLLPLPAGTLILAVDGVPVGLFTVTNLPDNPNPPGAVVHTVTSTIAQAFSADQSTLNLALAQAITSTTDSNAIAYLQNLQSLLPEFAPFLQTDLPNLLVQQDPTSLSLLERMLLSQDMPDLTPQQVTTPQALTRVGTEGSTSSAQPLDGDQWLEDRQPIIADANIRRDIGDITHMIESVVLEGQTIAQCTAAGVGGGIATLTSHALDEVVAAYGKITDFKIDTELPLKFGPYPANTITLAPGKSKQVYAGIWVGKLIKPVSKDAVEPSFEIVKECLQSAVIDSLPGSVKKLGEDLVSFVTNVESLGYGDGGDGLALGPWIGPKMISYSKIYGTESSGKAISPILVNPGLLNGACVVIDQNGLATACPSIDVLADQVVDVYHYHILGHWVDRTLEARTTHLNETFLSRPDEPLVGSFAAEPATIAPGQSSTLSWTTTNATSVSISGVGAGEPLSGSAVVSPARTTTYALTATGPGGTATAAATVMVSAGPPIQDGVLPSGANIGMAGGCQGGTLRGTFSVTAANNVSWIAEGDTNGLDGVSVNVSGSGSGPGTVNVTITVAPQKPSSSFSNCTLTYKLDTFDNVYVTFSDGWRIGVTAYWTWIGVT